jgi:uncharacterized protein (TIGR02453 family)
MINKSTLTFLTAIKKNNNKEWFEKNKEKYILAKDNVAEMIDGFLKEATKFEKGFAGLEAKNCVYRIYRDVRFSKDKKPYKNNLGASVNVGGKKALNAGYYIHIEPGRSFIAGGMWMPPSEQLKMIRQEIDYNGKLLRKILDKKEFASYYGGLDKEYMLKTTPKGYAKDHPYIDLLRMNSYIVWHPFTDAQVMKKDFVKQLASGAKIMKPFLDFINTSFVGNESPLIKL